MHSMGAEFLIKMLAGQHTKLWLLIVQSLASFQQVRARGEGSFHSAYHSGLNSSECHRKLHLGCHNTDLHQGKWFAMQQCLT